MEFCTMQKNECNTHKNNKNIYDSVALTVICTFYFMLFRVYGRCNQNADPDELELRGTHPKQNEF